MSPLCIVSARVSLTTSLPYCHRTWWCFQFSVWSIEELVCFVSVLLQAFAWFWKICGSTLNCQSLGLWLMIDVIAFGEDRGIWKSVPASWLLSTISSCCSLNCRKSRNQIFMKSRESHTAWHGHLSHDWEHWSLRRSCKSRDKRDSMTSIDEKAEDRIRRQRAIQDIDSSIVNCLCMLDNHHHATNIPSSAAAENSCSSQESHWLCRTPYPFTGYRTDNSRSNHE